MPAPIPAPVRKQVSKPISKPLPSPLYFYPAVAQPTRAPPRNFSRIDEEVGIASPYGADDEEALRSLTGPQVNTIMQHKRGSRSREWMKTLQSQDKVMRISRRRRSLTPWMKWMNSEWKNHIVAVIGEFIGTTLFLFFAFAGITVAKLQGLGPPNLLVLLYISASFGASLTVTLALALLRAVPPVRAVLLVITQLMGSCLAAFLVDEIFPPSLDVATTLGEGTTLTQGFFIEAITTATLVFTIIMLAVEKHRATFVAPLGIGMALFIGHLVAISFTGASLNPARSFGPAVVSRKFASEHWIYWAGPILGAGMAVLFFRLIKLMEYEMANPGQDGDPENDPTQNPNHEVAQNAQEREEEEVVELSPVSSGGFRDGSSWGITQRKVPMNNQNWARNYADPRGEMSRRLDDAKARWSRSEYGNMDQSQGQVQVHFTTTSPDIELPEGKRQLLVPTSVRRYGLSQILNSESMLDTDSPVPFDFLINGTFLRTTLDEYLTANGLSSETTLNLQYVRSLIPPLYEASFEHDDWVSSVDVLSISSAAGTWGNNSIQPGQERILSGSYDGLLRVWNKSGQAIGTSAPFSAGGHSSGIKSAKFISPTQIASAGLDRTIRVWNYKEGEDHFSADIKPTLELYGHTGSIDSIAVHGPSGRILSASADGKIGFWTSNKSTAPEADTSLISGPSAKRRKITTSTSTPQRGPLSLIDCHNGPASAVIFNPQDSTVAYSASQDHTIHTLDLTTSRVVDTRTLLNPILSLSALPGISHQILAAGTTARHIALIDPRASASTTQAMTLRGHTNFVSSICADPDNNYGLVSSSHDGTCRVWDLRSTRQGTKDEGSGVVGEAVYIIERESRKGKSTKTVGGEGVKVFDVAWDKDVGIVSGGEDKMVQVNRGRGVTRPEN
ncbi:putative Ribosome biogenesis ytm1 protein [Rutstroemia sp. NJR-2017a BBW]|nr:putative Ribosome biogenesis ytm1 protein [Rutstroemia sp. NJR-2017a BBW]